MSPKADFIYPEASRARVSAPIPKEFLPHKHRPTPHPSSDSGAHEKKRKGQETDGQRKLGDRRWEGLHDANHERAPVGLGSGEGRKHNTSVITGRDKRPQKPWDNTRRGGGEGSHYILRRK